MEEKISKSLIKPLIEAPITIIGCLVTLLLFPIFYLLLKIYSPGPTLYKSHRAGKNGKPFVCYKFRTMVLEADKNLDQIIDPKTRIAHKNIMEGPMFKIKNDPRLLPFGAIVRRFSLDEFPQFLNVLKSEMNVVGPRPPTVDETKKYTQEHKKRLAIKPGITGLWQTSGRNEIRDFNEILKLDIKYINTWSPILDIKIILKTIWVIIQGKGAY